MQAGLWGTGEFSRFEGCAGEDFQINGVAPGSFTVKGAQQTAYLYMYCYARTGWSQGLIITQGNTVVAHYVFIGMASTMYALKDINQNGFTELVLEGGFTGQGYTEGFLEIAELRPQRRLLGKLNYEFGQPYDDDCGVRSNGGVWSSRVIRVTPGPTPKFTQQLIQGRCGNFKVATSTGPVQPLKLTPAPTGWTPAPTR
ncbi:hypothetical protein [Deinococcus arcticus]|uniref:Uncharacterized protein n=1 Tax=Deinococcus arcticus TaxID=2136176 RepID=A0A2T3WAS1_9DEIO|nr:hypothetical protein [Deinococcus arcticus]PTA69001.1 hypothetical protein C8263_04165 [Deinococcus arcticus]